MAWELSSSGFLMTLSGFVPELLEEDFNPLVTKALEKANVDRNEIARVVHTSRGKKNT